MFAQIKDVSLYFDVVGSGLDAPDPDLKPKPVLIALSGGYGFDHAYLRLGLDDLSDQYQIIMPICAVRDDHRLLSYRPFSLTRWPMMSQRSWT